MSADDDRARKGIRARSADAAGHRFGRLAACVLAAVAMCGTACTSSDTSTPSYHAYDAKGLTCLDYPDVGVRVFRFEPNPPSGLDYPVCTPSCHPRYATAGMGTAPLDQDLPAGACDDEGATCSSGLMAGWCGPCLDSGGPGNGYVCTCRDLRWDCVLTTPGANICDPPSCLELPTNPGPEAGLCYSAQRTGNEVCACGTCRSLCSSDADCATGTCHVNELCFPPDQCPASGDCLAECTGFCL